MAICAICERPLARQQGISLAGTEAFHKACVRTAGTSGSVANRLRAKLIEIETEAVRLRDSLREQLDRVRSELDIQRRKNTELGERAGDAKALQFQLDLKKAELAKAQRECTSLDREIGDLVEDCKTLERERDAARHEAALHQMLAYEASRVVQTGTVTVTAATAKEDDERDATEVRFSLLELDDLT